MELPHRFFPFNRVGDRTGQQVGINLSFHEVILSALLDRLKAEGFVIQTGKNDRRDIRMASPDPLKRSQPRALGKTKIEQAYIYPPFLQPLVGFGQIPCNLEMNGLRVVSFCNSIM